MKRNIFFILLSCLIITNIITISNLTKVKSKVSTLEYDLLNTKNDLDENNKIYELRNALDNMLHVTMKYLVKKEFEPVQNNFYKNSQLTSYSIKFNTLDTGTNIEFIIPDTNMNLRQRAFYLISPNEYISTYEILDSGYKNESKYLDRIFTLNVKFIFDNNNWKISSLSIDE